MRKGSRYFTTLYDTSYAAFVLEKYHFIQLCPKEKRGQKRIYEIIQPLPGRGEFVLLFDRFALSTHAEVLGKAYQYLSEVVYRCLRRGKSVLTSETLVIPIEEDLGILEQIAASTQTLLEEEFDKLQTPCQYLTPLTLLNPQDSVGKTRKQYIQAAIRCLSLVGTETKEEPIKDRLSEIIHTLENHTPRWGGRES